MHNLYFFADEFTDKLNVPKVDPSGATLANVLNGFFLVIGALAVFFVIFGAIQYVTSAGDPGNTKRARETILYAIIGIVVAFSAWAIVNFVLGIGK